MDAIKAIDIQNRIVSVSSKYRGGSESYETSVMKRTIMKGAMLKRASKAGEESKAAKPGGNLQKVLAEMDEVGVELIFIDQFKLWSFHDQKMRFNVTLDDLDQLVTKSGGKIVPGGSYNPFRMKESLEELDIGVKEHGLKYMWFHPASYGIRLDDRRNYPLYAKCLELGIPVTVQVGHAAEPLPCEGSRPYYMDIVALEFPDLKIVLTHTGWPWIEEWISLCWKHPNVYGCINAYYPKDLNPAIVKFMDKAGRDKVMWGTNGWGLKRCMEEFLELPIRDECKKKILRDNAIEVFNLNLES